MRYIASIIVFILIVGCSSGTSQEAGELPISHEMFTELLSKHVGREGYVDYKGFRKDREEFNEYLNFLRNTHPQDDWSDEEQIAYWINAYNAFTIDLILQHYPVESIKDIGSKIQIPFVNTPWDIKFIEIGDEKYDLNNIEHGILRDKWEEPRIHFAVNCASYSCPKLRDEAYTAEKLNEQLDEQAREFINDDFRNDITEDKAEISKIFDWFSGDFKDVMPVRDYINRYADVKIGKKTEITYKGYDWKLNEQ